jgi:hypothetical protein
MSNFLKKLSDDEKNTVKIFFLQRDTLIKGETNLQIIENTSKLDTDNIQNKDKILEFIECDKLQSLNSKTNNVYNVIQLKIFCKKLGIKYTKKKEIIDYLRKLKKC